MRAVLQRVSNAEVHVEGQCVGSCGKGFLVLLGVGPADTTAEADALLNKIVKLRVFTDENDKMNLSVQDIDGEMLVVSQFTLYADCRHGNRPSFTDAAPPEQADRLYRYFVGQAEGLVRHVGTGRFGADMKVSLLNDGPVTICLDTEHLSRRKD